MSVGYANPKPTAQVLRPAPPSAATAETLVLVALILQVVGGVLVLGGLAWWLGFSILYPSSFTGVAVVVSVVVGAAIVAFVYFAYHLCYRRIQAGNYTGAQAPTLVIGILSLIAGILPGIFYLIAYVELGSAVSEQAAGRSGFGPGTPPGPPTALIACPGCGRVHPVGAFLFCPNCGQKLGP